MNREQLIIFDLDDTLVDTSDLYWRARTAFVNLIGPLVRADPDQIVNTFEDIDSIHIKEDGFIPTRYLKTMLKTYENLNAASGSNRAILREIRKCANLIRTDFPKPIDGAEKLLNWAFPRFDLALITRGEKSLQAKKIEDVGFRRYFRLMETVERKTAESFRNVIARLGFVPRNSWVIGDSIQTDINPGIEAGARCIWYAYRHKKYFWKQEHGHSAVGDFFEVSNLREAIPILEQSLSRAEDRHAKNHGITSQR